MATCTAELERAATAAGIQAGSRIRAGLALNTLEAVDLQVLDLTDSHAQDQVGLDAADIADDDWTACQAVGHAAYFLGYEGVVAPSASGAGLVIAAFETRLHAGQLEVVISEALTKDLYRHLR